MREELKRPLCNAAKILGIALVVYGFLRFLLPMAIPFLLAFLLAKWLYPMIAKLHKKLHLKRGLLAGIVLLLFLGILVTVFWYLGRELLQQLRLLLVNLPIYWDTVCEFCHGCCMQLERWTGYEAEQMEYQITYVIPQLWGNAGSSLLPLLVKGSAGWVKGIAVTAGVGLVTGIATLLILTDYPKIRRGMEHHTLGNAVLRVLRRVYRAGGGYVKAQLLIMLVVTGICVIGLFCTGNSYALIAGAGIGICDALPFLGTGTVFLPWAVIKLFQGQYLLAAAYAVIYTLTALARELLEPKLVGDKLGMPPLAVVFSVYVGLCIYGLWGFALGPVTYILVREIWREVQTGA